MAINTAQDWVSVTYDALLGTWKGFINFIPSLIGAIVVFLIGWIIALAVERLVAGILQGLRFNRLFEHASWKEALEKAELKVNPSEFIGVIFKWVVVILFLLVSVEILGLPQFADFLKSVVEWLPNLVIAVAIFIVAAVLADIAGKITIASLEKANVGYSKLAGKAVRASIWIFALLAILFQLGIATPLVQTLFTGLMAGLAIAFGLAFGLGGKELAKDFLKSVVQHWKEKS